MRRIAPLTPAKLGIAAVALASLVGLVGLAFGLSTLILTNGDQARLAYVDADHRDVWLANADLTYRTRVFDSGPGNTFDLSWSPDGRYLSFTIENITDEAERFAAYIVTADGQIVGRIPAYGVLAWAPHGATFAVLKPNEPQDYDADQVAHVRDVNGDTVCEFHQLFSGNFSADAQHYVHIALSDGPGSDSQLLIGDLATCSTSPVDMLDDTSSCYAPVFSPIDPSLIACGDELYDLRSNSHRELPGNFVKWSPDGRYLLLAREGPRQPPRQCVSDVCTVPQGDCPPVKVYDVATATETFDIPIAGGGILSGCVYSAGELSDWSPDSRRLVLSQVTKGTARTLQVWDVNTHVAESVNIPANEQWIGAFHPKFSPDGTRILFRTSDRVGGVWFMADAGTLTLEPLPGIEAPVWEPTP